MEKESRQTRLRLLLKKLNVQRKTQARKIDILCNDLISAHREFINRLDTISFAARFYESILAAGELSSLLPRAGKLIEEQIPDANIAFFLRQPDGFELHLHQSEQPISLDTQSLENSFTTELVENICKSNKVCKLEDLYAMGLQGNLTALNKVSVATIPLSRHGCSLGFILIYRSRQRELKQAELINIAAVTAGLCKAITACQTVSGSAK